MSILVKDIEEVLISAGRTKQECTDLNQNISSECRDRKVGEEEVSTYGITILIIEVWQRAADRKRVILAFFSHSGKCFLEKALLCCTRMCMKTRRRWRARSLQ
jgi:hypothetical protein